MATDNTIHITAKRISALRKHDRQDTNVAFIKDANIVWYKESCADLELTKPTPPKQNMVVQVRNDNRPLQ